MIAAPLPEDEDTRLAALYEYAVLDTEPEAAYDDIVRLAAFICGTPIAAISLIDADRQWFKSSLGLDFQEMPRDTAFCAHAILHSEMMIVPDATQDPRFTGNPLVTGDPKFRFYAGVPLVTAGGQALGALCVVDRVPRHLTPEQQASLQALARQVANNLQLVWEARQRLKGEDLLRQLGGAVASAVEGIVVADARRPDRPMIYVNPAFLSLTGYAENEVLGRNCRFLQGEETDPDAVRQIREALAAESDCRVTLRNYKKDGTAFWNELAISPVLDTSGLLTHFVGIQHDITERKEREQQVRDAGLVLQVQKIQLEAANADLAALATTDPLTGLLNYRAFQARLAQEVGETRQQEQTAAVALLDIDNFRFFNDTYGHALGDAVLRLVASKLAAGCSAGDAVAHFGGGEFSVLLPNVAVTTTPAEVEARLQAGLGDISYQPPGEASPIPITLSIGAALLPRDETHYDTTRAEALQRAEERLRRAKTGADSETGADRVRLQAGRSLDGFSMLDALVTAVDNKDRYTRKHSEDVMEYSLMIAHALGWNESTKNTVAIAALLHDVGKIGIPDAILRKPGRLTHEEFEAMKQHPMMGSVMVGAVPGLEETLDAVRHHHERWDGNGYPFGLREDHCPLIARVMAVADAFSAMTTDRPYRKGMARETALAILAEGAGTQWDPECVAVFLAALQK